MSDDRPIFVISDLHIGDGGPRDNFGHKESDRPGQLTEFLAHVKRENGELIIIGDLFEFWQASFSKVIMHNLALLDQLAELDPKYVLGNHDADLKDFIGVDMLVHPFFKSMSGPITRTIGGKSFKFMHGHEVDPVNAGDTPGIGRVAAILGGIGEDLVGSPVLQDGREVEVVMMGWVKRGLGVWRLLANWFGRKITGGGIPSAKGQLTPRQDPSREAEMIRKYAADQQQGGYDVAIVGHTHIPREIGDWYFNTGSWATSANNFARIGRDGSVAVLSWADGEARPIEMVS